ncbi:hypothetical protein HLB23_19725 [Nocardia uniformis]|uniref:Uncharacterized protein n=1 Tax=Nocardia uniformis TaxID=53432 RepID=A0A849CAX9_9NOCA|nr:hypothetical protein [Nocardia uniformis]NNH72059.1 hypothetical protein [Nocardia uniformis]
MLILTAIITTIGLIRRRRKSRNAIAPDRQRSRRTSAIAHRIAHARNGFHRRELQPALAAVSLLMAAVVGATVIAC